MTQDEIVTELLPCPFCGGKAIAEPGKGTFAASVRCSNKKCPVQPEAFFQRTVDAIAAWNTRSTAQEPALDDDALLKAGNALAETLKIYKASLVAALTKRELEILMADLHAWNVAAIDRLQAKAPETGEPQ